MSLEKKRLKELGMYLYSKWHFYYKEVAPFTIGYVENISICKKCGHKIDFIYGVMFGPPDDNKLGLQLGCYKCHKEDIFNSNTILYISERRCGRMGANELIGGKRLVTINTYPYEKIISDNEKEYEWVEEYKYQFLKESIDKYQEYLKSQD